MTGSALENNLPNGKIGAWRRQNRVRMFGLLLAAAVSAGSFGCGGGSSPSPPPPPTPTITTLSPNSATAGGLAFTLTVHGTNFIPVSTVEWNGSGRTTTFVSSSQLQAHIMSADLASAATVPITVVNPAPGGGTSNAVNFTVATATIAFQSSRALDGSNAANANTTANIWAMNPNGSSATPLTKLTVSPSSGEIWSHDGRKLAFESPRALDGSDALNTNATFNIWVMKADGSGATPLTKLTFIFAGSFDAAWTPDGSKVAFDSRRALDGSDAQNTNDTANIWVMNADGSGATPLTKLTSGANSSGPAWSPDGSKLAFGSFRSLNGSDALNTNATLNIWVMNADGSGATPLTKLTAAFGASSFGPLWSPDGSKLALTSGRALDGSDALNINGTRNIWVMNADGSGATPLTRLTALGANSFPDGWSPDGSKLAFESQRALDGSDALNTNGTRNIWVVNADGSGATPLTKLTAVAAGSEGAIWSPDGSKLFFDSQRALDGSDAANTNSTFNIWVMKADGSGASPLTNLTALAADSKQPKQP